MESVVLHRVGFLAYSCPKQGQDFKLSAAPLYPNIGQVPPPPREKERVVAMTYCSWSMGHLYLVGDCDFMVAISGLIIKLIIITNSFLSSTHLRKFLGL